MIQISVGAENTMDKMNRARCNSYSLGVSQVRDMIRSRSARTTRQRTLGVRFRQGPEAIDDDAAAAAKSVKGRDSGVSMEMTMIRTKSEPTGIANAWMV